MGAGLGRKKGFHISESFLSFHGSSLDLGLKGGRLWEQQLMGPLASQKRKLLPLPAQLGALSEGKVRGRRTGRARMEGSGKGLSAFGEEALGL